MRSSALADACSPTRRRSAARSRRWSRTACSNAVPTRGRPGQPARPDPEGPRRPRRARRDPHRALRPDARRLERARRAPLRRNCWAASPTTTRPQATTGSTSGSRTAPPRRGKPLMSSTASARTAPSASGDVHPPADPDDPLRPDAGHVPGRARPDDRQHRDPHDRRRPARPVRPGVGHHGVPDHLDDLDAALRQALRHLRPQAVVHVRDHDLRRRIGAVRAVDVDVHARRVPRVPGHRRRRPVLAGAGDHRRHHPAARAGAVPGLLPGRLRHVVSVLGPVVGGFLAGQRRDPRHRRLALDLLRSTSRSASWRLVVVTRVLHIAPRPARAPHRLVGRRRARRRPGAAADHRRAGRDLGLGLRPRRSRATSSGSSASSGSSWSRRRMGDDALLPLRLFRNGVVRGRLGASRSSSASACSAAWPPSRCTCRSSRARRPTKAGLLVLPMVAGIMIASMIAGQVTSRTGRYKIFPVIGSAFMVVGLLMLSRIGADTSLVADRSRRCSSSALGLGMNMQTIVLAMQNAVPPRDMGVATASATFFRQMGGTLGTAVFLSILFSSRQDPDRHAVRQGADDARVPGGGQGAPDRTTRRCRRRCTVQRAERHVVPAAPSTR